MKQKEVKLPGPDLRARPEAKLRKPQRFRSVAFGNGAPK